MSSSDIQQRKTDHLDLCSTDQVTFREQSTLFENVRLVHQALPDLRLSDVDTSVRLFGKTLKAPLLIAAMTGGTERAAAINQELAAIAESRGLALGLGSQRAMDKDPSAAWTYQVRKTAPNAVIFGNLGVVQARNKTTLDIASLIQSIDADALCVHMNPAMELVQAEGDRDFRDGTKTFARLVNELPVPVIAKETGCGISLSLANRLREVGVQTVDVSGAGGTSWVGVETLRATGSAQTLGTALWDWGIPTAVSVLWCKKAHLNVIATGGVRNGLEVAKSIALGATAAGIARPVLQALQNGGRAQAEAYLDGVEQELRAVMLLCGARSVRDLQNLRPVITGELRDWISDCNS